MLQSGDLHRPGFSGIHRLSGTMPRFIGAGSTSFTLRRVLYSGIEGSISRPTSKINFRNSTDWQSWDSRKFWTVRVSLLR
ncbi:hypothetical protein L596_008591 [Steinernema carpocapsae]|uniref:Uncharacterized protein n=1 Tax=Steinernema carpocapsae TaxID=34508 RepID=A0A4U5PD23_STECR|nr:hypothetical protein L596_008591 [Steinernema carpocapsae]